VSVEGTAALIGDARRLRRIARAYAAKYGSGYPSDSNVYAVTPQVVFGFIEHEPEFTGSATRWTFNSEASTVPTKDEPPCGGRRRMTKNVKRSRA
jgi:hypothetical protein